MNITKHVFYLYAETPIHAGTGVGLGAVDMPIQREKHTGYPIIQSSGVKGALRHTVELTHGSDSQDITNIFGGASGGEGANFAGAISPGDARILLFPVRALYGVFVWITSPTVLARFKRETGLKDAPKIAHDGTIQVSSDDIVINRQIMLEEYADSAEKTKEAVEWANYLANNAFPDTNSYWHRRIKTHLAILPDNTFRDFVKHSTEIVTRIHLDDVKKTVKEGQLFTQELLPADSLLYSLVHITDSRSDKTEAPNASEIMGKLISALNTDQYKDHASVNGTLQIGGDETVGRGRIRLMSQEV